MVLHVGLHFAKDRIVHRGRNRGYAALDTHSCRIIACMPSAYRRSIFNARFVAFLLIRRLLHSSKISILFFFLYLTIKFPIHRPQISSFFYTIKYLLESLLTRYLILPSQISHFSKQKVYSNFYPISKFQVPNFILFRRIKMVYSSPRPFHA